MKILGITITKKKLSKEDQEFANMQKALKVFELQNMLLDRKVKNMKLIMEQIDVTELYERHIKKAQKTKENKSKPAK